MNHEYNFHLPVAVHHSADVSRQLESLIREKDRIAIIASAGGFKGQQIGARLEAVVKRKTSHCTTIVGVPEGCPESRVLEIADQLRSNKITTVIAIGGGSAIDCARASILLATHEGSLESYAVDGSRGIPGISDACLPFFAVPTLFGTGSEISPAAIVTVNTKRKIIVSPHLRPKVVLVEPGVAVSAPIPAARSAAFDAFIQSLEATLSRNRTELSDAIAYGSLKGILRGLAMLRENKYDENTAEVCFVGGVTSSMAVSVAGVGAIHALSDPLTARCGMRHGAALAVVASEVLRRNVTATSEKSAVVSRLMSQYYFHRRGEGDGEGLPKLVNDLIADLGILPSPLVLKGLRDEIGAFVLDAQNPDMMSNPINLSERDIFEIYDRSIQGIA